MAVGLKGVGIDDVAARVNIAAVDGGHNLRLGKAQNLRPLPQLQARRLQLGSHGAVQNDIVLLLKKVCEFHKNTLILKSIGKIRLISVPRRTHRPCESGRYKTYYSWRTRSCAVSAAPGKSP